MRAVVMPASYRTILPLQSRVGPYMPIMDTRFVLQGITFIWDENKARENPRHHEGITFEQAA